MRIGFITTSKADFGIYLPLLKKIKESKHSYSGMHASKKLLNDRHNVILHEESSHSRYNYWMYSVIINSNKYNSIREVVDIFGSKNIQTRPIWKLMNTLRMFSKNQNYFCENSIDMYHKIMNIPCSTNLTETDIVKVVKAFDEIFAK